jgi:SNF2 family DNA or RNA helicase
VKTYGTLTFTDGKWHIECTPDVAVRLKRIFPRMVQSKGTHLTIKHTDEVAADLEWVLTRWPMTRNEDDRAWVEVCAESHRAKLARLETIIENPILPGALSMTLPPRDYQTVAASLYLAQGCLLLGDVVGLGKTVSAIASLTDPRTLPAIVVVKSHLAKQWKAEIGKFLPLLRSHIIKTGTNYPLPEAEVYIITFSKLSKWWAVLSTVARSVVYDEIQELRIPESEKYRAAKKLSRAMTFRLGMSATPIYNYGGEAWCIYNLLAPDFLGTFEEFAREWCSTIYGEKKARITNPVAFGTYLRNNKLFLRRTRKEVGRALPPIMRYVQDAEFDQAIYDKGTASADELAKILLTGPVLERGQAARQLDLELRQATGLAKAPFVAELVRMLVESGEKVLLGGWHRAVYEVWKQRLGDLRVVMFTGTESPAAKEFAKQEFIAGRADVMMMSLRSGDGTDGLQNVCSTVVLGELDWTPKVHEQFIGRIARDGQEESVQVFIPVAPVGSDPTMAVILGLKEAQSNGIIDLGEDLGSESTETDPQRLKQLAIDFLKSRGKPIELELETT